MELPLKVIFAYWCFIPLFQYLSYNMASRIIISRDKLPSCYSGMCSSVESAELAWNIVQIWPISEDQVFWNTEIQWYACFSKIKQTYWKSRSHIMWVICCNTSVMGGAKLLGLMLHAVLWTAGVLNDVIGFRFCKTSEVIMCPSCYTALFTVFYSA